MSRLKIVMLSCALTFVLALLPASSRIAATSPPTPAMGDPPSGAAHAPAVPIRAVPAIMCGWSLIAPNSTNADFTGVSALSTTDVWAVGYSVINGVDQTLIEQWNGSSWSVIHSPNVGTGNNVLNGVSALSATDVWAVGYYVNSSNVWQTLVEQWNGTSWSIIKSPNVTGAGNNVLTSVSAFSSSDVWAVGYSVNSMQVQKTLTLNWNGSRWNVVSSPNVGTGSNVFNGVSALSATDVWAVGDSVINGALQTLTEQWNGSSWSPVTSRNVGMGNNVLNGVSAFSPTDVWAVGYYSNGSVNQTLTEQWNGSSWSVVSSPNVGMGSNVLNGVSAPLATDIWAVGYYVNSNNVKQTLTEQGNGTSWSVISSPNAAGNNMLNGVSALSNGYAWAVGSSLINGVTQALAMQYNPFNC